MIAMRHLTSDSSDVNQRHCIKQSVGHLDDMETDSWPHCVAPQNQPIHRRPSIEPHVFLREMCGMVRYGIVETTTLSSLGQSGIEWIIDLDLDCSKGQVPGSKLVRSSKFERVPIQNPSAMPLHKFRNN